MQHTDSLILTIQGIAEATVFKKLSKKYNLAENQDGFLLITQLQ